MQKILSSLFLPSGLLLLAAVAFLRWGAKPQSLTALALVYPYAVLGVGTFLAWRFRRSWLAFAILAIVLSERALLHGAAGRVGSGHAPLLFHATALLLPLSLGILSFASARERGPTAPRIRLGLGLILFQALIFGMCYYQAAHHGSLLKRILTGGGFVDGTPIARLSLLAFGLVFLLFTIRFARHPAPVDSGFLWALIAIFLALNAKRVGPISSFYLSTAGLILIVSLIETSYSLAYHDELTGLPARRALNEALLRLKDKYTVAMIDVDHFKWFNDQYGHEVGDQVLRMIGANLERILSGARAFRYGGEEFAVLFPGRSLSNAIPSLETVRKTIAASDFTLRGKGRPREKPETPRPAGTPRRRIEITISIGIAERNARHTKPDEVIRAADRALYRAKGAGRNRIST
jgi:diguanylate cyclase (GGDEF)-like protein